MGKLLYTMGEVAQELGENPSAVRYWSNYFKQFVKPQRNAKGNRLAHLRDLFYSNITPKTSKPCGRSSTSSKTRASPWKEPCSA